MIITLIIPGIVPITIAADENTSLEGNGNSSILLPDLVISSLDYSENPSTFEIQNIYISVMNQGTAPSDRAKLVLYIDGIYAREWNVPKLSEGESDYMSYTWIPIFEGSVEIKAVVDKDNLISESDETNNEKIVTATVAEDFLPDLIIEDIVPESQGEVGKPLTLILKVKNQGTAASEEVKAKYYINGTAPAQNEINISALSAGTGRDVAFSLIPDREGKMEVKVLIDSGTSVYESNEDNNQFTKIIDVKTILPDLIIESFSLNPQAPMIGNNVTFTVSIKNKGFRDSESSELKYYINGNNTTYSNTVSVPAIAAGGSAISTFYWVPEKEGNLNLKFVADAGNLIREDDETNNEHIGTFSVSKQPVSNSGTNSDPSSGSGANTGATSSSSKSSSSKSSSMGSGVSKEPARNVEVKELDTRNIISGYHVKYDFARNATCVTYTEFDATKTFKKTTATVEVLKGKSIFVKKNPPGRIYKQLNIWIGDKGAGLPDSHMNAYTGFKVDKEWIKNNSVNESNITLLWYDSKWKPLRTEKTDEDDDYSYFRAETPSYSCFAISEYTGEERIVEESSDERGIQETLRSWEGEGKAILNSSAEREAGVIKKPMGKAKILLAISLPLFMILVEYFILKKKI
ncbi:MAG: CARDB domain-containing protein [Euryarchaeota archaeon]|nr:CARDB domain-containing protein [Euryarchaeota archaeon]